MIVAPYQNIHCDTDSSLTLGTCLEAAVAQNVIDFGGDGYCNLNYSDRYFHETQAGCLDTQFGRRTFEYWIVGMDDNAAN